MSDREKFLEERRTCIGGSDTTDLLGLEPFGCPRRLWYDKKGVPPDFPFKETFHIKRGTTLEPIAIREFANVFKVGLVGGPEPEHVTMPGASHIGAHVDKYITEPDEDLNYGVLEIKIPSSRHFAKIKQSGPPLSWQVQTQWNMMAANCRWGAIGVFNPDLWKILRFPVAEDLNLQQLMRQKADFFWQILEADRENHHKKLKDGDSRCDDCQWRRTCKGLGQNIVSLTERELIDFARLQFVHDDNPALLRLVDAYEEARAEHSESEKFYKELKQELLEELNGQNVVVADGRRVYAQTSHVPISTKEAYVQKRVSIKVLEP